ncbi:vitamin B12 transporter BtuB [Janthinobacterium sp. HH104]|uniref:TonB-dependent receptor n=1 Tax=Janthinobacterium sp. HH104 TaxID=1537276 RepID=UPI000874AA39|nr:TonB-dependent receptor [Janthinobacterium sp. HH104]OEZ82445.1 vitamin B12 transporter BtuB [Janthinobacterium sp. HH104]
MNSRLQPVLHPIAAAAALLSMSMAAQAQQAPSAAPAMQEVVVTGIRASLEQSLSQKRNSDSVIDVVSAEDIGKLPDKNVADAVQRVPGVNISSSAGGEGGFSENDRVSIRGTSPSLTQTLINGHAVGTGDWFVTDQVGTVGRSVSFALLPSEIVSRVTVQKSAQADLVEGGVAGSINIETRKPLSFKQPFTAELALQAIYADLPGKTDPQMNALFNWKNEAKTMGVLFQVFSEKRHERRDGQEFFGYGAIDANSPAAQKYPQLAGVLAPLGINSALFEQVRKRQGGSIDLQLKPTSDLMLDVNGFYSKLDAANYNRSFYNQPGANLNAVDNDGKHVGVIPRTFTVKNNTLVAADFPASQFPLANATTPYNGQLYPALVDQIYRPGSNSSTAYIDFNGSYRASERLRITGSLGYTRGIGETPVDLGYEAGLTGVGVSYQLNGLSPARLNFPGLDISKFSNAVTASAWGSHVETLDTEKYGQADGELSMDYGVLESLKFGARYAEHHRNVSWPENRSCAVCDGTTNAPLPKWSGGTYSGDYGKGLGGSAQGRYWQLDPADLVAWANKYDNSGGPNSRNWPAELDVKEKDSAAYIMANLAGNKWRGNVGVRVVRTQQTTVTNVPGGENPIGQKNIFGTYTPTVVKHSYTDVLPSANIKFDLSKDLVARAAVAKTMARADYSALVGAVNLNDQLLTGTGGNPDLKPIRSTNYDATLEWYFAPKAMLSVGAFYMDMKSYVTFGTAPVSYYNNTFKKFNTYVIQSPTNIGAKNKGVELSYQQGLWGGFGVVGNYTYTNGKADDGAAVVGSSRGTYNLEGYYEDERLSARLAYTYRSSFLAGLFSSSPQYVHGVGNLAASINYKIDERYSLTFDVLNLNNPVLKYYGANQDQPTALYSNGRQFYFGLRAKL